MDVTTMKIYFILQINVLFLTQKCMEDINAEETISLTFVLVLIVMKDIYLIKGVKVVKKLNAKIIMIIKKYFYMLDLSVCYSF